MVTAVLDRALVLPVLALPPREDEDDPRGRDQLPETDVWTPGHVTEGPDHTKHADHPERD